MRRQFIKALVELAHADKRVVLLTADLGYTVVEPFQQAFPDRFFNVGVAEQNMLGMATGMAEAGIIPFVYSIGTFATARAYEFVRNGPLLHRLPVRIIGVGAGYEYGTAGFSHHVLEDVALMSLHAGMMVVTPADARQAVAALSATWRGPDPVYYRIGKDETYEVPGLHGAFDTGRAQVLREGRHVLLIALGTMARGALEAAKELAGRGVNCGVMVVSCVRPAPIEDLVHEIGRYPAVMTVEAHNASGGLGALVAEVIAERGLRSRLVRCAVRMRPDGLSGSEQFMLRRNGLDRESLVQTALRLNAESGN